MLSKNTVKFIKSLQQKKFRKQENAFFVEGAKNVTELLLSDFECTQLLFTEKYAAQNENLINRFSGLKIEADEKKLSSIGTFSTNSQALAVATVKPEERLSVDAGELALALDDVRDPGNLGTIIRIADWYGIKKLYCSPQTADFYNPKVLNASMGSFSRVRFQYVDLDQVLGKASKIIFGAFLEGQNIHQFQGPAEGILLVGNESRGISQNLESLVTHKVTIPAFGGAESLNVAIATAVLCDNLLRLKNL